MLLFNKLENHFQIGFVTLLIYHTNGFEKPQIFWVELAVLITGRRYSLVRAIGLRINGFDHLINNFFYQYWFDLFSVILMIFKQLNIQGSLPHLNQVSKLINNMPVLMQQLLILPALINKMVQQLKTFLKRRKVLLINLLLFLLLQ